MDTRKEDHPGLLLVNSMMQANRVRDAIRKMLLDCKVVRFNDYRLMVDFVMHPDRFSYEFCLRVFPAGRFVDSGVRPPHKTPVLTIWSQSRDGLVSDTNVALLLVLYNS